VSEKDKATVANDVYRRRFVRVGVATAVSYTIEGEDSTHSGESNDLGGGGIRLATKEDIPFGAVLRLRFPLPLSGREVTARGRIVLSFYNAEFKQFNHGVAFTQIDPKDQEEIVRYVDSEVKRKSVEEDSAV
jgi:c-di-GMP-binding flagellar brake protein YcgR